MDNNFNPDILSVIDEDGNEIEFEKLDEYDDDETGKTYIAITEYPETDESELIILISEENDDGEFILLPIEDALEYATIEAKFKARLSEYFNFTEINDPEEE